METKGALIKKFEPQRLTTKGGKEMMKGAFLIQQEGQYGKPLYIETLNAGVIQFIEDTKLNSVLNVKCDASSREWNDKYFTSVMAFNVTCDDIQTGKGTRTSFVKVEVKNEPPATGQYAESYMNTSGEDDGLPF